MVAVGAVAAACLLGAPPAQACIGQMDFSWAVSETKGGILEGRVVEAVDTMGRGIQVRLEDVNRIAGDPPMLTTAALTMGSVCEQWADVGDRVWLLFDVDGLETPPGLTVTFVVEGPDAVSAGEFSAALAGLPATDAIDATAEPPTAPVAEVPWALAIGWLAAFILALRRNVQAQGVSIPVAVDESGQQAP